jgi:HemY protein
VKTALLLLAFFVLAVVVGNLALDDPGVVMIGYGDKLLQTSLVVFVVTLVVGLVLVYLLWRVVVNVIFAPSRLQRWYQHRRARRAQKALVKGYLALAEGDWTRAERTLISDASAASVVKLLHYLGAAYAAQQQNALERRDDYLSLAHEAERHSELAIGLTRAEMQLRQGQWEQAEASLLRIQELSPKNPRLLTLMHRLYWELGRWEELAEILKPLEKSRLLSSEEMLASKQRAFLGILDHTTDDRAYALDAVWDRIPSDLRGDPQLMARYCRHLISSRRSEAAERLLRKALLRNWDADLIRLYAAVEIDDPLGQLSTAEAWLPAHPNDPDLLYALGRLAYRAELWAKARSYLESCLREKPMIAAYQLLTETLEKMGESESAALVSREGLALAAQSSSTLPVTAGATGK